MKKLPASFKPIVEASVEYFGVNPITKTRRHRVVTARMMITNYLMRNEGVTNAIVCDVFDIPHSLVIYYLNRHEDLMVSDDTYKNSYLNFKRFLFNP